MSNFAGILVPFFVALITIPLAVKGLGDERYGLLSIVWVVLNYLSLLDFGVSKASSKFLAEFHGTDEQIQTTKIIHAANIFALFAGAVVAGIMLFMTPWVIGALSLTDPNQILEAKQSFVIISVALPLLFLGTGLRGAMEASRQFHSVNLGLIITNSISYAIPAVSFYAPVTLTQIIFGVVAVRALSVIYYAVLVMKSYHIRNLFGKDIGGQISKLLKYGSWVTLTSIVSPLLVYIDRIFIGTLLPIAYVAYYSVPYDLVNRIRIFPQALLKTLFPEFSQLYTENRKGEAGKLIEASMRIIVLVVGALGLLITFYSKDILTLWLGSGLAEKSAAVMMVFGIGFSINSVAFIPFNYLQSIGRPDIPAKIHALEIPVYIALLFFFIKSFGIFGAAMAWGIRVTIDAFLNSLYMIIELKSDSSSRQIRLPYKELLILVVFAMFQLAIRMTIVNPLTTLVLVMISCIVALIFTWRFSLTSIDRLKLTSILRPGLKKA